HAVGAVARAPDGLPVGAGRLLTGAALAGALDGVVGHRRLLGLLDGVVERRVAVGITATRAGRHLDVLDQLREELAPLGIDRGLLVLGGGPFGVAAHSLLPSGRLHIGLSTCRLCSCPPWTRR